VPGAGARARAAGTAPGGAGYLPQLLRSLSDVEVAGIFNQARRPGFLDARPLH